MKTYSIDLRERVVKSVLEEGTTQAAAAQRFSVSLSFVEKLLHRYRETGSVAPGRRGGRRKPAFTPELEKLLKREVKKQPDATLAELRDACGVSCSTVAVHNTLKRLGLRRKKNAAPY